MFMYIEFENIVTGIIWYKCHCAKLWTKTKERNYIEK